MLAEKRGGFLANKNIMAQQNDLKNRACGKSMA
jgi:hypothetical protein